MTAVFEAAPRMPTARDSDWSVAMSWHDLLFAHWPIRPERLRSLIPAALEIDTFDGWAWIGLVPFRMTGIRLRRMPQFLSLAFPELNVRTYVRRRMADGREKGGVWFLSLDATSRVGVCVAKTWYQLPYHHAKIYFWRDAAGVRFTNRRRETGRSAAELKIDYRPVGPQFTATSGSLDHWLVERYSLFTQCRSGRIACADIFHQPWQLQAAEAEIELNSMFEPLGLKAPTTQPVLHFAQRVDAVAWSLQ